MNLSTPLLQTVFSPLSAAFLLDGDEGQKADGKVPPFKVYSQIGFLGQGFPVHV